MIITQTIQNIKKRGRGRPKIWRFCPVCGKRVRGEIGLRMHIHRMIYSEHVNQLPKIH